MSGYFQAGGTELNVNTLTGASWYVLNTAANALPTDGRWLIAQITTTGDISGILNTQIFPLETVGIKFRSCVNSMVLVNFEHRNRVVAWTNQPATSTLRPTTKMVHACSLMSAAFVAVKALPRALATVKATYLTSVAYVAVKASLKELVTVLATFLTNVAFVEACIPEGACDCEGNVLDECGVCGGQGIAEGACDCEGNVLDECGVCGGSGIAEGECDCDGNVLDACGVCGGDGYLGCTNPEACNYDEGACGDDGSCDVPFPGCQECVDGVSTPIDSDGDGINDCDEVPGCTDSIACNYDEAANISDGSCEYAAEFYDCDGSCLNDADGDGICDELEVLLPR